MTTSSWKTCSSFEGYYSSTGWLKNQNCYCDPLWIYGYLPTSVGQITGRKVEIDVPLLYSKSITSSYEAWLYVDGSYQSYTSGSVSLNASDTWKRFTFNNVTAKSGAYYEVKIDFGYGTVQCYTSNGKKPEARVTYVEVTACGAPTSVYCSSSRIIPDQPYTFSWSGATSGVSNDITGYDIAYKYSGDSNWNYPEDQGKTSTSFQLTPSGHRGQTLQFAVRTKGSYSSSSDAYWSSWAYSGSYTINTQPEAPTYSISSENVPSGGGSITFQLYGSDAQGDSLKFYYKLDKDSWTECASTFTYSFKAVTEKKEFTFSFKTNDGYEDSQSNTDVTITQCAPIKINSVGLSGESLKTQNNIPYYYKISATPEYSGGEPLGTSATLSIYMGDSSSDVKTFVRTYKKSIKDVELTDLSGKFVKIVLTVSTILESATETSDVFYVPEAPSEASSVIGVWNNGIGSDVGSTGKDPTDSTGTPGKESVFYFGRYLYVKWKIPDITDSQVKLESMSVVFTAGEKQAITTVSYEDNKDEYTATVDGAIFEAGDKPTLSIISTDGYQTATLKYLENETNNKGFECAAKPEIKPSIADESTAAFIMNDSSGEEEGTETIYRPRSGIIGAKAGAPGGEIGKMYIRHNDVDFASNGITWIITTIINNQEIKLVEKRREDTDSTFFTHTIDTSVWQALLLPTSLSTTNQLYTGIVVTLKAKDDFGNVSEGKTAKITVDYREVPTWNKNNTALVQKIVYGTNLIGNSLINDPEDSNKDYYLVNRGEKILLSWSTKEGITDLNNEYNNLKVYVERTTGTIKDDGEIIYGDYTNINSTSENAGFYRDGEVEYVVPQVAAETPQKFRIYVTNSNGLHSSCIETETYTIACKTDPPIVGIAKVEDKAQDGNLTITPQIEDLGANEALKDNNNNKYTNYERNITINGKTYVRQALFSIELSQKGDFSNKTIKEVIPDLYLTNSEGKIVNKYYSSLNGNELSSISTEFTATNLFLRCKLTFRSGFKSLVDGTIIYTEQTSGYSSVYIFYAEAPTVSHRRYQVGINTNKLQESDAFMIKAISEGSGKDQKKRELVRLEGVHNLNSTPTSVSLLLNMNNSSLVGSCGNANVKNGSIYFLGLFNDHGNSPYIDNFTIDGGTW